MIADLITQAQEDAERAERELAGLDARRRAELELSEECLGDCPACRHFEECFGVTS